MIFAMISCGKWSELRNAILKFDMHGTQSDKMQRLKRTMVNLLLIIMHLLV